MLDFLSFLCVMLRRWSCWDIDQIMSVKNGILVDNTDSMSSFWYWNHLVWDLFLGIQAFIHIFYILANFEDRYLILPVYHCFFQATTENRGRNGCDHHRFSIFGWYRGWFASLHIWSPDLFACSYRSWGECT